MLEVRTDLENLYDVIPFSLTEYELMRELFASAFGVNLTKEVFNNRFNTEHLGCEVIGFIAKYKINGEAAAYYGVFPVKIKLKGQLVLAAQSGDTMTHERHRKKGLFIWLAKKTFTKCKEKGIEFVFGIPNHNSYPGFINKLEWEHLDNIVCYDLKLKVKTLPLAKLFLKAGLYKTYLKMVRLAFSKNFHGEITDFTNSLKISYGKINRDKKYLEYKRDVSKAFLKINNAVAWVNFSDVLWIGDFSDYSAVDEVALKKLKRMASLIGYNTIRFHINESAPRPDFLRYFKKQNSEPSCFFYLTEKYRHMNLLLTAADFDTW